jgi:hypothetical protein
MPMVILDIIITPTAKSTVYSHSKIKFPVFSATCERSLNNQCVPILQLKHKMKLFSKYIVRLCITNNNTFTILHFSFWPISQIIGNKIYKRASPSVSVITWYQQLSSIFNMDNRPNGPPKTLDITDYTTAVLGWPKGHPSWNGWWSCCSWCTRTRRFPALESVGNFKGLK